MDCCAAIMCPSSAWKTSQRKRPTAERSRHVVILFSASAYRRTGDAVSTSSIAAYWPNGSILPMLIWHICAMTAIGEWMWVADTLCKNWLKPSASVWHCRHAVVDGRYAALLTSLAQYGSHWVAGNVVALSFTSVTAWPQRNSSACTCDNSWPTFLGYIRLLPFAVLAAVAGS